MRSPVRYLLATLLATSPVLFSPAEAQVETRSPVQLAHAKEAASSVLASSKAANEAFREQGIRLLLDRPEGLFPLEVYVVAMADHTMDLAVKADQFAVALQHRDTVSGLCSAPPSPGGCEGALASASSAVREAGRRFGNAYAFVNERIREAQAESEPFGDRPEASAFRSTLRDLKAGIDAALPAVSGAGVSR
jgi:hypothetical protein